MKKIHVVSVRTLAEFACATGSVTSASRMAARMREGREGHVAVQRMLDERWVAELPISLDVQVGGVELRVQGRADAVGVCTVIGFPTGYATTAVKAFEAADATDGSVYTLICRQSETYGIEVADGVSSNVSKLVAHALADIVQANVGANASLDLIPEEFRGVDKDGIQRVYNGTVDIGAYEYDKRNDFAADLGRKFI